MADQLAICKARRSWIIDHQTETHLIARRGIWTLDLRITNPKPLSPNCPNLLKSPNWREADRWPFEKRGGVESGTTKQKPIQWQGGGFEIGTSGLQMQHPIHYATLLPLHRGNLGKHLRSPRDFFFFSQIIHTCGTLDTGMIAQLLVAEGNRHETFTVQKA